MSDDLQRSEPTSINEIRPGLYLGNWTSVLDGKIVEDRKIRSVVSLMCESRIEWSEDPFGRTFGREGHFYRQCSDCTFQNMMKHMVDCCDFIDRRMDEGSVAVHCRMGISRSATIVIAWLMRRYRYSLQDALRYVQWKRPEADPNAGFLEQLRVWEEVKYRPWLDKEKEVPAPAYQKLLGKLQAQRRAFKNKSE